MKRLAATGLALLFPALAARAVVVPAWEYVDPDVVQGFFRDSRVHDMVVDSAGDVHVVGYRRVVEPENGYEPWLKSLSSGGSLSRTHSFFPPGSSLYESSAKAVAVIAGSGGTEDLIVGGQVWSNTWTGTNYWLARFAAVGSTTWMVSGSRNTSFSRAADAVEALAVNGTTVYVAGRVTNTVADSDFWVAAFDGATGTKTAEVSFPVDPVKLDQAALDIAVTPSGRVVVAGFETFAGQDANVWVRTFPYDLSGVGSNLWTVTVNGAGSTTDYTASVALDPSGEVVVAGALSGVSSRRDIWIRKISPSGTLLWERVIDGGEGDHDSAEAVAVGLSGSIYVTGVIDPAGGGNAELWMAHLAPSGSTVWEATRSGAAFNFGSGAPSSGNDEGTAVAVDPATGASYVAGRLLDDPSTGPRFHIWKLTWVDATAPPRTLSPPPATPQAYPNPYRPGTGGDFDAAGLTFRSLAPGARIRVYAFEGVLVAELHDADLDGVVTWDAVNMSGKPLASGVYWFVVTADLVDDFRGKVVIIR